MSFLCKTILKSSQRVSLCGLNASYTKNISSKVVGGGVWECFPPPSPIHSPHTVVTEIHCPTRRGFLQTKAKIQTLFLDAEK